jgi:hypothetical protein
MTTQLMSARYFAGMANQSREFGIKDPNGYALIPGEDISKKL